MRTSMRLWLVILALLVAGCGGLKFGSDFPSPTKDILIIGKTGKSDLLRFFGEPHQVGLDTGDPTWAWTYARVSAGLELTKQLTVRFDEKGLVKSYSFTSNLPEDMKRLK